MVAETNIKYLHLSKVRSDTVCTFDHCLHCRVSTEGQKVSHQATVSKLSEELDDKNLSVRMRSQILYEVIFLSYDYFGSTGSCQNTENILQFL